MFNNNKIINIVITIIKKVWAPSKTKKNNNSNHNKKK